MLEQKKKKNFFLSYHISFPNSFCVMCAQREERIQHFPLLTITSVSLGGDRVQLIQRKPNHIRPVLVVVVIRFFF